MKLLMSQSVKSGRTFLRFQKVLRASCSFQLPERQQPLQFLPAYDVPSVGSPMTSCSLERTLEWPIQM